MSLLLLNELILIFLSLPLVLIVPRVGPKSSPYSVHSPFYLFFFFVLGDQQKYSETSESIIGLDYSKFHYVN